jgi:hypothetical protein
MGRFCPCRWIYPWTPHTTAASQKANVTRLTTRPFLAHGRDQSTKMAASPSIRRYRTMIPPRDARTEPHPRPGTHHTDTTRQNQGAAASARPIFLILFPFMLSYSLPVTPLSENAKSAPARCGSPAPPARRTAHRPPSAHRSRKAPPPENSPLLALRCLRKNDSKKHCTPRHTSSICS